MKEKTYKTSKIFRIMFIYRLLENKQYVNPQKMAMKYGVDIRSIQRDISDLRSFLSDWVIETGELLTIQYDAENQGYTLVTV